MRVEIHTQDKGMLSALQEEGISDLRLTTRVFVCDSADWIPPAEKVLTLIIEGSSNIALSLLASWLYDRFKARKPEQVLVNETTVHYKEIITVIERQVGGSDERKSDIEEE